MRWLAAGALLCALAVGAAAAPADARPRAAIAFLPYPSDPAPLLDELARRPGMAIGLTSPTVGGFKKRQMALDMSQGTRIPTRLYSERIGALELRLTASGRWVLSDWEIARRRAEQAPGDVVPGLLASTVGRSGGRVAYAGIRGRYALGAIVAADEDGRIGAVTVGDAASLGERAVRAWTGSRLLLADLPAGAAGLRALDALLRERGRDGRVYVVRAPEGEEPRLLASGLTAAPGEIWSATTRRTGLVAATDVAPTVLRALGIPVPDEMQGEPIESRGEPGSRAVADLGERLSELAGRRGPALLWFFGLWLVLLVVNRPRALRLGLVAALWFPGVALVTAALSPGQTVECALLAVGSFGLAAASDLLLPWPAAPGLPAAVVFAAHAADLASGSSLIGTAITGPNPAGGARFYGIGNELEAILSVSVLVGTGAGLVWWGARRPQTRPASASGERADASTRRAPLVFALAALVAAGVLGAGRLGADVGAVITLGAGGAAAALAALGTPPTRRALAAAVAAPVVAIGALALLDLATGGGAHLTRSVLHAHGSGDLWDVVRRRFEGSFSGLRHPGQAVVFTLALAAIAAMAWQRRRLLAPVSDVPVFRAGLVGAWFAVVVGALSNDSGPLILEIGAVLLGLAAAYVAARTLNRAPGTYSRVARTTR